MLQNESITMQLNDPLRTDLVMNFKNLIIKETSLLAKNQPFLHYLSYSPPG